MLSKRVRRLGMSTNVDSAIDFMAITKKREPSAADINEAERLAEKILSDAIGTPGEDAIRHYVQRALWDCKGRRGSS